MRWLVWILVWLWGAAAWADTYTYDVADFDGTPYASLDAARLDAGQPQGVWAAGDTVTITGSGSVPVGTGFVIDTANLTLQAATNYAVTLTGTTSGATDAIVPINASGVLLRGFVVQSTSGAGATVRFDANAAGGTISGTCRDCNLIPVAGTDATKVNHATGRNANIDWINVVINPNRDVVVADGFSASETSAPATYSRIRIIDCKSFGNTNASNSNCVSHHNSYDTYIIGGLFDGSGGPALEGGTGNLGRLYIDGATVRNTQTGGGGASTGGIHALEIRNTTLSGCVGGIVVTGDNGSTSLHGTITNCTITRGTVGHDEGTMAIGVAGINVLDASRVHIVNTRVAGYNLAHSTDSTKYETAILVNTTTPIVSLTNCYINNAYKGIDCDVATTLSLVNCSFNSDITKGEAGGADLEIGSTTNILMAGCIVRRVCTGTGDGTPGTQYNILAATETQATPGGRNYVYGSGLTGQYSSYTAYANDISSTTEAPVFLSSGAQATNSPVRRIEFPGFNPR